MTGALLDPTSQPPWPVPLPFWAALVDAPTDPAALGAPTVAATPPAAAAGLSREHSVQPSADSADVAAAPGTPPQSVDVVFADLTDTAGAPVDGRLGMLAASMLGGGGIFAVLTRCRHDADGALVDATGGIVASAQNADLLYLQHIVIPAQPLQPPRTTEVAAPQAPELVAVHEVAHADLLVFARTHQPSPGHLRRTPAIPRDDRRRSGRSGAMSAPASCAMTAGTVWATAQDSPAVQRRGRYVAESMAHPAKMLPAVAAHAIAAYSQPGELVLDPMCGIGTTLVEALHLGRRAVGVEYETRWAEIARANIDLTGATRRSHGCVYTGDARHLDWILPPELYGQAALVVTSPPYGPSTHGRVTTDLTGVHKRHHLYGDLLDRGNWPTSATTGCWPGSPASSPSQPRSCAPAGEW